MESGKPLSPLLFCLAEEVLSRYISHAAETGDLIPIRAGRQTRVPTHLLYADDILLFCQASSRNCQSLSRIFEHYASISGQCVNYTKSKIFFGSQVPQALRRRIKRSIGFSEGSLPFIYLGVPANHVEFSFNPSWIKFLANSLGGEVLPFLWLAEFVLLTR